MELSTQQAGEIIGVTRAAMHSYIQRGLIDAEKRGIKGAYRINIDNLREFAKRNNYVFNEAKLQEFLEK